LFAGRDRTDAVLALIILVVLGLAGFALGRRRAHRRRSE
jgi:LPXTG-motif cell wall-anchored protein